MLITKISALQFLVEIEGHQRSNSEYYVHQLQEGNLMNFTLTMWVYHIVKKETYGFVSHQRHFMVTKGQTCENLINTILSEG